MGQRVFICISTFHSYHPLIQRQNLSCTSHTPQMTTPSLKEDILRLKYSLHRDSYPPVSSLTFNDGSIGKLLNDDDNTISQFSNRGNKLLYNSDDVDVTRMTSKRDDFKVVNVTEVLPDNHTTRERLVITNKISSFDQLLKKELDEEFGAVDGEDKDMYDDIPDPENILTSIDIANILGPITDPSDIVNKSAHRSVYLSGHLSKLAEETIEVIEKEQDNVNQLSKLMNVFLGDDALDLLADNLKLPYYDHHLDLEKEMKKNEDGTNDNDNMDTTEDGDIKVEDNNNNDNNTEFEDRRITRAKSIDQSSQLPLANPNEMVKDPFFQLPQYVKDFNYGISKPEDAEESRQLIQIALQRNEEFIRSLTNIRNGFIRADRLKGKIYSWCKEINDEREQQEASNSTNANNPSVNSSTTTNNNLTS